VLLVRSEQHPLGVIFLALERAPSSPQMRSLLSTGVIAQSLTSSPVMKLHSSFAVADNSFVRSRHVSLLRRLRFKPSHRLRESRCTGGTGELSNAAFSILAMVIGCIKTPNETLPGESTLVNFKDGIHIARGVAGQVVSTVESRMSEVIRHSCQPLREK
jgi:hypothetical protein